MASRHVLVDTSFAVALVSADHSGHQVAVDASKGCVLGLSGHAWFETFSVLTRLPAPARRSRQAILSILKHDFPESRYLSQAAAQRLTEELRDQAISGGAIYDALVGAAAREQRLPLMTRDLRALPTYRMLGVDVEAVLA